MANLDSWNMGCCIPKEVMGEKGLIPTRQKFLRSLSLTTLGACIHAESMDGLKNFKCLREFTWRGLKMSQNQRYLEPLLRECAKYLKCLELEQQFNINENMNPIELLLFTESGSSQTDVDSSLAPTFPDLRSLTLGQADFSDVLHRLSPTFRFENLHTLKLRYCDGAMSFLHRLTPFDERFVGLRVFEITHEVECPRPLGPDISQRTVDKCLQSFRNLEELNLSLTKPVRPAVFDIQRPFNRYCTSLKRFILHTGGSIDPIKASRLDLTIFWLPNLWIWFRVTGLEAIGLTVDPPCMVCVICNMVVHR